ncbi:ABC transporter ATP-binding protein [Selenomonadales bacterium OttesenSCG-928-I06]|nr:ABC transporter ATP-binding protein [Selenomonadales bacterium OttesenSCG-928-I06]
MIKLENIKKIYSVGDSEVIALGGINLSIKAEEFVAVMGPSGSGKSTLMNILGCLDRPTSGKYYLDGLEIAGMEDKPLAAVRNKKIGFVFQSFNLIPRMTSLNNVALPLVYAQVSKKERLERAKEALDMVGLTDRMDHMPNELSGGQKQRVAIARALVNDPSILMADEPTGNLDSKSSNEIMEIFCSLNDKGRTIILVTHEPDIAEFAKRTLTFKDGLIISDAQKNRGN